MILSIPTTSYGSIVFDPPLPPGKEILADKAHPSWVTKVAVLYDTPWWREAGLSGSIESTKGPVISTRENCSEEDGLYAVECFIGGDAGRGWFDLPDEMKGTVVLGQLAEVFGADLGGAEGASIPDPVRMFPKNWDMETKMNEGPVEIVSVGILSGEAGKSKCNPCGNIHFVGAQTARMWRGQMEGAVRSGMRGAQEVIAGLREKRRSRVWARL